MISSLEDFHEDILSKAMRGLEYVSVVKMKWLSDLVVI